MTNLAGRPNSSRGRRRREQLIDAGIALLAEGGWPAVTTRAVAERAGTNPGLIHYHFGGLPGLRVAVARHATDMIIEPVFEVLLSAPHALDAVRSVRELVPLMTEDERNVRVVVELIAGAMRHPDLGAVFRGQLRAAREQIARRLAALYPSWSAERRAGVAVLCTALLDGLTLHLMLDAQLPADAALAVVEDLTALEDPTGRQDLTGASRPPSAERGDHDGDR